MELLEASVVDCQEYRVLAPGGEMDAAVGDTLPAQVVDLIDRGRTPLLIDITDVRFCDSTGGRLAFCGPQRTGGQGFRVTGMDRFVAVYLTLADAVRALTSHA
jgi:anti-anti-sigma factor